MLTNTVTQPDGLRANFAEMRSWIISTNRVLDGTTPFAGTVSWSSLTGTPTTLAGYGITVPLAVDQGGTGASEALVARQNLEVPRVTVSESEPGDTVAGDIWHIPSTHLTYIFDGSNWYTMAGVIKP